MGTKLSERGNRYSSFILALWREGDELRCRLENPRTGERIGFKTVAELVRFLEAQIDSAPADDRERPDAKRS